MRPYYYSLNEYLNDTFGKKIYKLAINGGMSCPNRDGLIDTRGCIFCSSGGSGDFAGDRIITGSNYNCTNITAQIESGMTLVANKYKGNSYIAYFQAFTNTYAPIEYLRKIYTEAILHPNIVCVSIATRPDCINSQVVSLLSELSQSKPIWVELGLQTIHETSARYIRRGYDLDVFESAVSMLNAADIETIVHMIIGLPGESQSDMYDTADYLAHQNINGIKLQLLHVLKHTDLARDYADKQFEVLTLDEYTSILANIIELLPRNMVIHRLTGDGPKNLLIAPSWSCDKKKVLNTINTYFKEHDIIQGKYFV